MGWCGWCGSEDDIGDHAECNLALGELYEDRAAYAEELARLDELAGLREIATTHRERALRLRNLSDKMLRMSVLTVACGAILL